MRLPSDIGGTRIGRPVDRTEHERADWELLTESLQRAVRSKGLWVWDEGRRATEDLGAEYYDRLSYYQRRILALESMVLEHGMLTVDELNQRSAPLPRPPAPVYPRPTEPAGASDEAPAPPRFTAGARVRVRDLWPPGHVRTPAYVRGRQGRVTGVYGPYRNPETRAYGGTGLPPRWLYGVEFRQRDLWEDYAGHDDDVLVMDIYEQWIEPPEADA